VSQGQVGGRLRVYFGSWFGVVLRLYRVRLIGGSDMFERLRKFFRRREVLDWDDCEELLIDMFFEGIPEIDDEEWEMWERLFEDM